MTLIERWAITVCVNCGVHRTAPTDKPCASCEATSDVRTVSVVPADQLRGAVGAIEALAVAKQLAERHLLAYAHADTVIEQIDVALELLEGRH